MLPAVAHSICEATPSASACAPLPSEAATTLGPLSSSASSSSARRRRSHSVSPMSVDGLELDRLIRKSPTSLAAYISELQANQNSGPEESLFAASGSSADLQQAMSAVTAPGHHHHQPPVAKVSPQPFAQEQPQHNYQQTNMQPRPVLQAQRYQFPQQQQEQSFNPQPQALQPQQARSGCEDLLISAAQPQLQQFGHLTARDETDLFANLQYQVSSRIGPVRPAADNRFSF